MKTLEQIQEEIQRRLKIYAYRINLRIEERSSGEKSQYKRGADFGTEGAHRELGRLQAFIRGDHDEFKIKKEKDG